MELNDTELNQIYFEADSDDVSNKSDDSFMLQKSLSYFKQFNIVQTSEGFPIRGILYRKAYCVFPNKEFFLTETFVLTILILLKMSILLELRFETNVNIYKISSFKDFENVIFVFKSFKSGKLLE